jgi:transposase, IS30 family
MGKVRVFVQLTEQERTKIEVLLQQKFSYRQIATALDRSVSTISREIRRNQSVRGKRPVYYSAGIAERKTRLRHRIKPKKVVFDQSMKQEITAWLTLERLSPRLISIRGKQKRYEFVSHEWIYQWIWKMKKSMCRADEAYQKLYRYLRHARRRWHRGRSRRMRGNILERKWIDERPIQANQRSEFGHLEGDIILGKDRQPGNLVVLDRKSRKCWLRKLKTKNAAYVTDKLKEICLEANCKTLTLDNDQSFAMHYELHKTGIKTFFTHPYSSQEKGSVENRIGIIRMFFPKKTDFKQVNEQQISEVQNIINNRPLRIFNYKSPSEIHIS